MTEVDRLQDMRRVLTAMEKDLQAYRDSYQKALDEYKEKNAKYKVGDRVRIPELEDNNNWEVRMVRVSPDTHRIWYTVHEIDNPSGKLTLLAQHLTKL